MFGFSQGSHFPACRSPAVATASCGVTFHLSPVQSSNSCLHRGSQQTSTLVQCCWCAAPPSLSDSSKFVIVCGSSWALPDRWQGGRTCCDIPLLCCKSSSLTSETDSHFQVSWCWAQLELLLLPELTWIVPASEIPISSLFLKSVPFIVFKTVGVPSMNNLCGTLGVPEGPRSNRGHTARKICPWTPYKKKVLVGVIPGSSL